MVWTVVLPMPSVAESTDAAVKNNADVSAVNSAAEKPAPTLEGLQTSMGGASAYFEENVGQFDEKVKYLARTHTRARFVRFSPDFNTSGAVDLGFISANARNEGLRNGYIHASILPDPVKKKILAHLKSLSPGTHAGNWSRNEQISYVIELAAAGRRAQFFK